MHCMAVKMSLVYAGTGVMVGVVIDGGVFETVTEVSDWAEPPSPSLVCGARDNRAYCAGALYDIGRTTVTIFSTGDR